MRLLRNLKENWRDLVVGLGISAAFCLAADGIENLAIVDEGAGALANFAMMFKGVALFFACSVLAWIPLAWIWPELSDFLTSDEYDVALKEMSRPHKMFLLAFVVTGLFITAALCFTA